ncbi:lantibiotic dehydratase [Streptomyces sp. NPDC007206]|uniref:lantibiotic dehydratase n=1 Tax=Streptomyces sp. NPDC007206 TaxID=3154317 RepID=UPI00340B08F2
MAEEPALGAAALLRVAGMPLDAWAAAGNPELFAHLADHARDREHRAERARSLAERLGATVVPHPELTATDRRAVLDLRRRLHSGAAPGPADCRLLAGLAAAREVTGQAAQLRRDAESADRTLRTLEHAVAAERERIGTLAWSLVCADPVMRAFLHESAPAVMADVRRRLAKGESWSGQRLRKSGAYLWRALGRAAAKTTPRGWAGQVVPVPLTRATTDADTRHDTEPPPLVPPGTVLGAVAAEAVENVHLMRGRLRTLDLRAAGPTTLLAPAPLHFLHPAGTGTGPGVLRCWVIDPRERGRMRQVVLRRTRPLESVLAQLSDGPRTLEVCEAALLGTAAIRAADPGPGVLRGFLAHLLELGVLQICTVPRRHGTEWVAAEKICEADALPCPAPPPETPNGGYGSGTCLCTVGHEAPLVTYSGSARALPAPEAGCAPPPAVSCSVPATGGPAVPEPPRSAPPSRAANPPSAPGCSPLHGTACGPAPAQAAHRGAWFLDSYRTVSTAVPRRAVERVQRGLGIATRVAWLREADRQQAPDTGAVPPEAAVLDERPRPLGEILARLLPDGTCPPPAPQSLRRYAGWHPAVTCGSGYARLLAHLAARAGEEQVDLDEGLLDALGAPPARTALPPWPLDCLMRPLPGPEPVAVLETASPAGVLDARFADALHSLYGSYANPPGYRAFLSRVERLTGARFVELLVPPLAERAANAVRRPVVTDWWTGDPDPGPYLGPAGSAARYLPLDRITLRRVGPQVVAEADGRRLLPVHHATRTPLPPYDVLVRLLLAAGHPAASRVIRLDGLAEAFPRTERLPRVTVGGELVVSPAVWRVPRERLWRPGDSETAKARTLAAQRVLAGLPRFAFVRAAAGAKPVPVDFDALTSLHLLDRITARQSGADLLVEEMLPGPGGLLLRDPLHEGAAVAAQLLLRLPCDQSAGELATLAAAALSGGPDVPGTHAPKGRAVTGAAHTIRSPEGGQQCPTPWH